MNFRTAVPDFGVVRTFEGVVDRSNNVLNIASPKYNVVYLFTWSLRFSRMSFNSRNLQSPAILHRNLKHIYVALVTDFVALIFVHVLVLIFEDVSLQTLFNIFRQIIFIYFYSTVFKHFVAF